MVFCVRVAVGAGAGYSIELGVGALSGLSEIMILANLMSRLMHLAKKKNSSQAAKTPRSMSGFIEAVRNFRIDTRFRKC